MGTRAIAPRSRSRKAIARAVDVLPAIRSSRFDLPLTYDAADMQIAIGDVVRAPLGSREILAFVISDVRDAAPGERALKPLLERLDVPPAFDRAGLHIARFMAERYICTLGEALGAVVLAGSVPRMRDWLAVVGKQPAPQRHPSVPPRLLRLIWEELAGGFALERLLRHPEARRAGDRATLLRCVQTLTRAGELRRERLTIDPRTREYRVKLLELGDGSVKGRKAEALVAFVRDRSAGVPRADALLAGFSSAVIARAVKSQALRETEVLPSQREGGGRGEGTRDKPTEEQAAALERVAAALERRAFDEMLLYGVTGSGKTLVYVEAIERVLREGNTAIVLVPEISLTPQTARRFEAAFGRRVAVLHSALSERERFDAWQACRRGDIDVIVGARSAVFAPLKNVRLIVVDESHEASYKQESTPRYQAVAIARERMRHEGGVLVLGSATPSVESYAAALAGRIGLVVMRKRATNLPLPIVRVVNLGEEFGSGNRGIFSGALVQAMAHRFECGEKAVLFLNRRGSAAFVLCRNCGYVPQCPRCTVSLAVHRREGLLRCHYCDHQAVLPRRCPACGGDAFREFGAGTQAVAAEVSRLFPRARVFRMDSDSTTHVGDHARILDAFERDGDVLIGTQMVAKGLDFPSVTLAAVIAADIGLHVPDFRAAERSFSLIAQACGRSGRARAGEAFVQTYAPEHPAVVWAARHDYEGFAERELQERAALGYPPARRLIYLGIISRSRNDASRTAHAYADALRDVESCEVLGPATYPIARLNGEWRFRVAIKTRKPATARAAIRERILPLARADRRSRLAINVDP